MELLKLPIKYYQLYSNDYIWSDEDDLIYPINVYDSGLLFSTIGITIEPKLNILSKYNSSFFIKTPLAFDISVISPGQGQKIKNGWVSMSFTPKEWGVFSYNLPILIGYSKNLNSSLVNSKSTGYSFSLGAQFMKISLVGSKSNFKTNNSANYTPRKEWFMPLIGFDYYWLSKKEKIRGVSIILSPTQFYFKAAYTFRSTAVVF